MSSEKRSVSISAFGTESRPIANEYTSAVSAEQMRDAYVRKQGGRELVQKHRYDHGLFHVRITWDLSECVVEAHASVRRIIE